MREEYLQMIWNLANSTLWSTILSWLGASRSWLINLGVRSTLRSRLRYTTLWH